MITEELKATTKEDLEKKILEYYVQWPYPGYGTVYSIPREKDGEFITIMTRNKSCD